MNWLSMGIGAGLMALVAYGAHSISVNVLEARHRTALEAQANLINGQCTLAKAITVKVSDGLQTNLSILDADGAALDSLLPCTGKPASSLAASPATGHDGQTAGQVIDERIVRTFEPRRIVNITKKGERYRVQLLACQAYVDEVQKAAEGR